MQKKVIQTWHEIYTNPYDPRLLAQGIVPGGLIVVRPEYLKKLKPQLKWTTSNKQFKFIRNASTIPSVNLSISEMLKLKDYYKKLQSRLIVFFGFIYEHKGTDLLFEIADPELDQIVIAGEFDSNNVYHQKILNIANSDPWKNKVSITGFLEPTKIASLLAVADAVILPFRVGGGEWNTTIHTAILQKAFVLTTSESASGYDEHTNVYYAKIGDISEMRKALELHAGKSRKHDEIIDVDEWKEIALQHQFLYERLL
jgi:glycosyltransferase involved in cell wall biosynthesis